jgi:hypothetical protein
MVELEYIYMFLSGELFEWEDATLMLDKDKAILKSIQYPKKRVEIFKKDEHEVFNPTYQFYKNGVLYDDNISDDDISE